MRKKITITLLIIILISILILCELNPFKNNVADSLIKAEVTRVVDGDTIYAKTKDRESFKIRYIGIDTPECDTAYDEREAEEGRIASMRNEEIIRNAGNIVFLEYDTSAQDKYGRDLCYVYIKSDYESEKEYIMIQEILLSEGMCSVMTVEPNVKYEKKFLDYQSEAKKNGLGFWRKK